MRCQRILQRLEARLGRNTLAPDAANARLQAGQGAPPPPSGALFISWRLGFADAGIHPRWLVSERSAVSAQAAWTPIPPADRAGGRTRRATVRSDERDCLTERMVVLPTRNAPQLSLASVMGSGHGEGLRRSRGAMPQV